MRRQNGKTMININVNELLMLLPAIFSLTDTVIRLVIVIIECRTNKHRRQALGVKVMRHKAKSLTNVAHKHHA
jgi:hypothetical protein